MNPPTPTPGLIDTPVLIGYREGQPDAVQFMLDVRQNGQPALSQLSALVLLAWPQDAADRVGVEAFLFTADVRPLTARIANRAQTILESLAPPCGLTADDAIVAATAIENKLPLYTLDPARFATVPGLTALRPY
jgi:predicted nucleic acid-binding protein